MARLIGPDENSRLVYTAVSGILRSAAGKSAVIYTDEAVTTLADVLTEDGDAVAGSTLTVDAYSKIPLFQFPDSVDVVYAVINGGPVTPLYARMDDRIDSLATRVTAVESGGVGDALLLHKAGPETVTGVKTFSASPIVPTPSGATEAANKSYADSVGTTAISTAAADATSKANAAAAASLPAAGGTLSGSLVMPGGFRLPLVPPLARRPMWRDASGYSEQFQSGHSWTASGAASSNLNDTTDYVRGTQSARITSNGAGGQCNLQRLGAAALDLTGKQIRLLLKIQSGAANLNNLNVFVGTSSLANNFRFTVNPITSTSRFLTEGQWCVATCDWADVASASGTYSITSGVPSVTSGFTDLRVQVIDNSAGAVALSVQAVEVIDAATATFPNGVISITFDDSWSSPWDYARPKMDALGFRGTQYTIVDLIDTASHLTRTQLRHLQDRSGWEIAGHAYTSAAHNGRLPSMTAAQVDTEIGNLKAWLVNNGFDGDSFAYPGGQFEPTTDGVWVDEICARYFSTSRTILAQAGKATETFPPPMAQRLRCASSVSSLSSGNLTNPASLVAAGGGLDKTMQGGWLILCFHQIVTGSPATSSEISQTDFNTIMDGIASRGIPVRPVSDVIRHYG